MEHLQELHGCRSARGLNRMVNSKHLTGEILILILRISFLKDIFIRNKLWK